MPNRIKIRNKTSTGAPSAGDLVERELCFVEPDNKLYIKKTSGTVVDLTPAGGGGGSTTFTTIEVNLGTKPRLAGEFDITGTGFSVGRPVLIMQASGPYTGKGTMADEATDQAIANAYVATASTIKVIWQAVRSPLVGNVKFNYAIM